MQPFDVIRDRMSVLDCVARGRMLHWADDLFRGLTLERKVAHALLGETVRRVASERTVGTVLVVDLQPCGASVAIPAILRACLPCLSAISYAGLGLPMRGSRDLIRRGLETSCERAGTSLACDFSAASATEIVDPGPGWVEAARAHDLILVVALDGRVSRRGPLPLPKGLSPLLGVCDAAVVSLLDAHSVGAALPRLGLVARHVGEPLEITFEIFRHEEAERLGTAIVPAATDLEPCRLELHRHLDTASRFAHRVTARPAGGSASGAEVVEWVSPGLLESRLLAGLSLERIVPAGSVRIAVIASPRPQVPSRGAVARTPEYS